MSQHDELAKQFTVQLQNSIDIVSGETPCLTEGTVDEKYDTGSERLSWPTADGFDLREAEGEDQDYIASQIDMDRRWVDFKEYYGDVNIKQADMVRSAIQPNSDFVTIHHHAVNRNADKCLIDAASAVAYAGKSGTTEKNLLADCTIAHGGTGFTVTKCNTVIERAKMFGRLNDGQRLTCLWNSRMETTFKMTEQVSSGLYSHTLVLEEGYVKKWGPIDFIRIEDFVKLGVAQRRMLPFTLDGVSSGVNLRKAVFYTKSSFKRWRPKTAIGDVVYDRKKRRWTICTDAYVGCARGLDDGVFLMGVAETPLAGTAL